MPLPGRQPEESDTEVQPLADGRVLVRRTAAGRHHFALLYPTGPVTGRSRWARSTPGRTRRYG